MNELRAWNWSFFNGVFHHLTKINEFAQSTSHKNQSPAVGRCRFLGWKFDTYSLAQDIIRTAIPPSAKLPDYPVCSQVNSTHAPSWCTSCKRKWVLLDQMNYFFIAHRSRSEAYMPTVGTFNGGQGLDWALQQQMPIHSKMPFTVCSDSLLL